MIKGLLRVNPRADKKTEKKEPAKETRCNVDYVPISVDANERSRRDWKFKRDAILFLPWTVSRSASIQLGSANRMEQRIDRVALPSFDALSAAPILSYRVRRPSEDRTEGKIVKRKGNREKKRERINISNLRQLHRYFVVTEISTFAPQRERSGANGRSLYGAFHFSAKRCGVCIPSL